MKDDFEKALSDAARVKMIESRLNDPQKVVVLETAPRMSFYEYWKSTKPLLKPESVIIMIDSIHYKKLKPRKRRNGKWII